MRLYLIRHATAVPSGTPGFLEDTSRPLTDEGRAEARRVAQALRRMKIKLDLIITSPYLRAAQTAEVLARGLDYTKVVRHVETLRAEADPRETSQSLRPFESYERVAFVGHEPHLSAWLAELVSKQGMQCIMKKGGVACVEIARVPPPIGSGTLRWLLTPKHLGLMAAE